MHLFCAVLKIIVVLINGICLFREYLLTVCVTSETELEPQGGERISAELDD